MQNQLQRGFGNPFLPLDAYISDEEPYRFAPVNAGRKPVRNFSLMERLRCNSITRERACSTWQNGHYIKEIATILKM